MGLLKINLNKFQFFFYLETNERKRRMSEFESDIKIQNEVMGTLVKYVYGPKDSKLQTLDIRSKKLSLSNKDRSSDAKEDDI